MTTDIDILLATYNGAAHLQEQLDSLMAQTVSTWHMLARDDGSSDGSVDILSTWAQNHAQQCTLLPTASRNLGACGNFSELLHHSTADFSMLCDQDDVWLPGKIELTQKKMAEMTRRYGPDTPLLVHTDFCIVDGQLVPIAASGHRFQGISPASGDRFNRLLVQNTATGCTMMINRALRELAVPIPPGAVMHDHWLMLAASCFGRIGYLPKATLLYRQHGANAIGAQSWNITYALRLLRNLPLVHQAMQRNRAQAGVFRDHYQERLSRLQREALETFCHLEQMGPLQRRRAMLRYRFFYNGLLRNIGGLLFC